MGQTGRKHNKKSKQVPTSYEINLKLLQPTRNQNLITSNFYSILYYNSEIWHLPKLAPYLKNLLLPTSAKALKLCTPSYTQEMSFIKLHEINKRATPEQHCIYKHSLTLHHIYNVETPTTEWLNMNFNQAFSTRNENFKSIDTSN